MSQAKVEKHKQEKANRKKLMRRQKIRHIAAVICGWVVVAVLVGWAGYSIYSYAKSNVTYETYYCDPSAVSDYMASVSE